MREKPCRRAAATIARGSLLSSNSPRLQRRRSPAAAESSEDDDDEEGADGLGFVVGSEAFPLSEWAAVESQCRHRLARVDERLRKLRSSLEAQASAFVLNEEGTGSNNGVLQRLAFLQADAIELSWRKGSDNQAWQEVPARSLAAAEWNALLDVSGGESICGRVERLETYIAGSGRGCLLVASEKEVSGDYCAAAWRASRLNAAALLVACDGEITRPMAFGSEQEAPPIPAAMLPRSVAASLLTAAESPEGAFAKLRVLIVAAIEEDAAGGGGGVDEGLMADVVALDDATSQKHHGRFVALQAERERLTTSLRFASRVQQQLTLQRSDLKRAYLFGGCGCRLRAPRMLSLFCRSCLQRAASGNAAFRCPLCRTSVLTWTVTVFAAPPRRRARREQHPQQEQ